MRGNFHSSSPRSTARQPNLPLPSAIMVVPELPKQDFALWSAQVFVCFVCANAGENSKILFDIVKCP